MLVVLGQAPIEPEPGETALDDPGQASDLEGALLTPDDLQLPTIAPKFGCEFAALVTGVCDDGSQLGPQRRQSGKQPGAGDRVRDARWLYAIGDRDTEHVDQNVAFPSLYPFVAIEAANAPLSLVFTDCPSMMPSVGSTRRPAALRASGYSARCNKVQTPARRQRRK